jgi:mannose-6-phosphate isomerase-like protein (cupin superfamily)
MADYTAKRIDDMYAIYRGAFKLARAELGVSAFGMQVLDIPPGVDAYPEHDHAERGVEEVYVTLRGSGEMAFDDEKIALDPETMVRVGADTKRKITPGSEGIRILAIGGVPGEAYEPAEGTALGTPDPMAAA